MHGGQDFKPGGDLGVDGAVSGEPSAHGVAVLAAAPDQLALRPSDGEQTQRKAVGGHRPRGRRNVSILDTTAIPCRGIGYLTMLGFRALVQGDDGVHGRSVGATGANDESFVAVRPGPAEHPAQQHRG